MEIGCRMRDDRARQERQVMTTVQKAFTFLVVAAIMLVAGIAISKGIAAALIVGGVLGVVVSLPTLFVTWIFKDIKS